LASYRPRQTYAQPIWATHITKGFFTRKRNLDRVKASFKAMFRNDKAEVLSPNAWHGAFQEPQQSNPYTRQ
jgi:hypothetical protein